MSAPFVVPLNQWTDVEDPDQIADFVRLVNLAICSGAEDEALTVSILSRYDHDAPQDLEPNAPGGRHLEATLLTEDFRLTFITSLLGRPGSELLGFTADELGHAAKELRSVITDLAQGGTLTQDSRNKLEELHLMLEHPNDAPGRFQPIATKDVVCLSVFAECLAEKVAP
jgi:hypothetical protein